VNTELGYLSQYSVWLQTGWLGDQHSIPGIGERIFPLASVSRPALRLTQTPIQRVPGVLSPGTKRGRGHDADHSTPSSAKVKNEYELYLLSYLSSAWW
jgi:hypothetical protein